MFDFTIHIYKQLLEAISKKYSCVSVEEFLENPVKEAAILRHDVDALPRRALEFASIQNDLGIKGTYYFRVIKERTDEEVIRRISGLGHNIGYHYENLSSIYCSNSKTEHERVKLAYNDFKKNLTKLRDIVPIRTICMHGSPFSKWDSRILWKYYNYFDLDIIGEPYFDINAEEVLYITDTGRRWNGSSVSVRDKISYYYENNIQYNNWLVRPKTGSLMNITKQGILLHKQFIFKSTSQIINAVQNSVAPQKLMITIHPQRWNDNAFSWALELIKQNVKNVVKYYLVN